MTAAEIEDRVVEAIARLFDVDRAEVVSGARLHEDLGLDSIDAVDLAVEMQTWTGRRVEEKTLRGILTVADVVRAVEQMQVARG